MVAHRRQFILRNTSLQHLPFTPELRLYIAAEITPLWRMTGLHLGALGLEPPFWAFAWAGGLAIARYLLDHPQEVSGRRVLDFAAGSGLCAIAAMKAGAASALAADVDPFCASAVALNAAANDVAVAFTGRDLLAGQPPASDLILAGDVYYEEPLARRVLAWLRQAHAAGARVLVGDPGRAHLPRASLLQLAQYEVPTSPDLEGVEVRTASVYTFRTPD